MAMTLRPNSAQDEALEQLSAAWGVSKQQAALRAITAQAEQLGHAKTVDAAIAHVIERDKAVLERLRTV